MKVMDHDRLAKSDFVPLGILAGVCLLLGLYLIVSCPLMSPDGVFYIEQARCVVSDPLAVTRRHPPGYPLLVWAAHALTSRFAAADAPLLWVRSAQGTTLLCRVLALVLLYFLGKRLVGRRDSFLALLILAVLPYPAYYGSDVLREWPYVLFLSLGFWMLYRGLEDGTRWPFAVAGLAAGLGYLIRPECAQLLIYGAFGLLLVARHPQGELTALVHDSADTRTPDGGGASRVRKGHPAALLSLAAERRRALARWGAGLLLLAGFAIPAAPCIRAVGTVLPQQLSASPSNAPPVVLRLGSQPARGEPLAFEARAGEWLEVPIEAFDPEDGPLMFSLVGVPAGSRPVYQFRSLVTEARFWTLSENERSTLLAARVPQVWQYDGIVGYAYPRADAQAGLLPVHRFWSVARLKHFYTISDAEKETLCQPSAPAGAARGGADWQYEGIVFYAFPADRCPPDAVPVYRLGSEPGIADFGLQMADSRPAAQQSAKREANPPSAIINPQSRQVAWYMRGAGQPPAGVRIENRVLRWRPRPDQQGEYWINIVVSDGRFSTCQLVQVRVQPPLTEGENRSAGPARTRSSPIDVRAQTGGSSKSEARSPKQIHNANDQDTLAGQVPFWISKLEHSCLFRISKFEFRALNFLYPASGRQPSLVGWAVPTSTRPYEREKVCTAHPTSAWRARYPTPGRQYAGVARLPEAVDQLFDAITEDLMVVFLVPWLLGLYYRLRYQAGRAERVLVPALLLVNVAAMLARYAWIAPGSNRRYSLGLLALTIFYIPVGLQLMAGWLTRLSLGRRRRGKCSSRSAISDSSLPQPTIINHQSSIINAQRLLLAVGIGTCIFRLFMAPTVDKSSYRVIARWLQENTVTNAVVAVPDTRISFYADRPAVFYRRQFDPRRVDYAVRVEEKDPPAVPPEWRQEFSAPFDGGKGGKTIVVYRIEQVPS